MWWDFLIFFQHNHNVTFAAVKSKVFPLQCKKWQKQANANWTEATGERVTHQLTVLQEMWSLGGGGGAERGEDQGIQ